MEITVDIGANDEFKHFKIEVQEINLGVADETRTYTIKAENRHQASKKLYKYLCNFYEDRLSMWPGDSKDSSYFTATFQRNGGYLKLKWLEN